VALDREDLAAALGSPRGEPEESSVATGADVVTTLGAGLARDEATTGSLLARLRGAIRLGPELAEAVVAPGVRAVSGAIESAAASLVRAREAIADGSRENVRVQYGLGQARGLFDRIGAHLARTRDLVAREIAPARVGTIRTAAAAARGELSRAQIDTGEARRELGEIADWARQVGVRSVLRDVAAVANVSRQAEGELRLLGGRAAVLESLDGDAGPGGQVQESDGSGGIPPHAAGDGVAPPDLADAGRPAGIPPDFTFGEEDLARIGTGLDPSEPPPQTYWNEELVNTLSDLGRQQGGVTDADGHAHLLLAGQLLEGAEGQAIELGAVEIAVALKAAGIPLEMVDPNQLASAARYVNTATDAADQQEKLRKTLDNFQILTTIGAPPLTRHQMVEQLWAIARVPGHALERLSDVELRGKYQEVLAAVNAGPGQSELKVGKHNLSFTVGENGQVTHSETKKPSFFSRLGGFFKKIAPIALTVASFIPFTAPFARIAQGAISLVKAVRSRSLLGAVTSAAGMVAGGATAIVGRVAEGTSSAAATVARVANGVARGLQGVSSIRQGSVLGGIAALGSGVADAIGRAAEGAATGLQRFANRLGDTSARLSYAARGIGIVDGYRAAGRAVNEARVLLREAEASGDAAAIAAARGQLEAAEKAKTSALLGGAASAAGLAADVRADHTIFPGEAVSSPIPQGTLDQVLRGASRGLGVAQGVQSGDYAAAGVNALGLAAAGRAAMGSESPNKLGLSDLANMADAGLAYHQTNVATASANQAVSDAEAALEVARASGDPAAIQAAQAHLDQARKGREGALMGAIAAGDSLVLTAAQIGQKFHDSRRIQGIEEAPPELEAALQKEQERALATWKEADEQEELWLAQLRDERLSPQEREAAAAGILALRQAKEAYNAAIEESPGDPEKLHAATVAFEDLQARIETEVANRATAPAYAALRPPSAVPEAAPSEIVVTIQPGMTIWEISQRTGVPVERILEYNAEQGNLIDTLNLRPDQTVRVPNGPGDVEFPPRSDADVRAMQRTAIAAQQAAAARTAGVPSLTPQDAALLSEVGARFESGGLAAGVEALTHIIDTGSPAAREEARRWLGEIEKEHLVVVQHQNTQNIQALTHAAVDATSTSWFDLNPVASFMRWAGHEDNIRAIAGERQESILIQTNGISVANGVREATGLTLYELARLSTDQLDTTLRTAYPDVDPARLAQLRTQLTSALVSPDVAALSRGSYQTGTFTWETGQGQVDTSFADGIATTMGKAVGETARDAREYAEVMRTQGSWWERPLGSFSANTLDAVSSTNRFVLDSIQTAQEFYGQQGGVLGTVGEGLTFAGSALSMVVTSPLTLADYRATDEERMRALVDVSLMLGTAGLLSAGAPVLAQFGRAAAGGATRLAASRLGQAVVPRLAPLGRAAAGGARLARTPVDDIFRGAGTLALRQGTRAADALGSTALGRVVQAANQRVLSPLARYSSRTGGFLNRSADAARDYFSLVNNFTHKSVAARFRGEPFAFGTGTRSERVSAMVNEAARASGIDDLSGFVDDILYDPRGSYFTVADGRRVLSVGDSAFARTRIGQLQEAAHELVHAQQFERYWSRGRFSNIDQAADGFFRVADRVYARQERVAEYLSRLRIHRYVGGMSAEQWAASTRYINSWSPR
jgi:LysM repeat protein